MLYLLDSSIVRVSLFVKTIATYRHTVQLFPFCIARVSAPLANLVTAGMDLVWKMFSKAAEKFLEAVRMQLVPQAD